MDADTREKALEALDRIRGRIIFAHRSTPLDYQDDIDLIRVALQDVQTGEEPSAAEDALDDIAWLCEAPRWEYPGQVVRDVCLALGIPYSRLRERPSLNRSPKPNTSPPEEGR